MDKKELLQRIFGYPDFRSGQEQLIDGILAGRDVFGIMPTGGGKSMCYQLPALMLPGVTLVISPLISLMRDQVLALKAAGIPAAYINSSLNGAQMRAVYRNLRAGLYKIVYVAPERLDSEGFWDIVSSMHIPFIAVDEAHCISQWGQDFRPSYLRIVQFIERFPVRPTVGAFTATATEQVRDDIERILKLKDPVRTVTGFDRPNLFFDVLHPKNKRDELLILLAREKNKSGIIYCTTRKNVESVHEFLIEHGYRATRYHAGLTEDERAENQEDFLYDRKTVMVATNAFGMGIDKSNVGFVIHYNMPKSIEAYYQEAGRAGRDGSDADCILLFARNDIDTARFMIENSSDNEELDEAQREIVRAQEYARLDAMTNYCRETRCLRGHILEYFGQEHPEICGNCGTCKGDFVEKDITQEAQMILSCVTRVHMQLGFYVGRTTIIHILAGAHDKDILSRNLDSLSTYGLMKTTPRTQIGDMIDKLLSDGYLRLEHEHKTIELTPKSRDILYKGAKATLFVRKEDINEAKKSSELSLDVQESALYERLRALREKIARKNGIPPYIIFSNATLADMAKKAPKTQTEFRRVSGVGEIKAAWYAEDFLDCIRRFDEENA